MPCTAILTVLLGLANKNRGLRRAVLTSWKRMKGGVCDWKPSVRSGMVCFSLFESQRNKNQTSDTSGGIPPFHVRGHHSALPDSSFAWFRLNLLNGFALWDVPKMHLIWTKVMTQVDQTTLGYQLFGLFTLSDKTLGRTWTAHREHICHTGWSGRRNSVHRKVCNSEGTHEHFETSSIHLSGIFSFVSMSQFPQSLKRFHCNATRVVR